MDINVPPQGALGFRGGTRRKQKPVKEGEKVRQESRR